MKQTFSTHALREPELGEQLARWFRAGSGRVLLEQETHCADQLMRTLFGYYMVGAGFPGEVWCPGIRCPVVLGGGGARSAVRVAGSASQMPFQSDSVDVVLLAHALDFSADPHRVLREADRILIPEGRLILFGFNPFSPWSMGRLISARSQEVPWCASFLSAGRVGDWLRLLGFVIELERPLTFQFASSVPAPLRHLPLVRRVASRVLAPLATVYVIQAVKRVTTPTPILPPWKLKRMIPSSLAEEPTTRSADGR